MSTPAISPRPSTSSPRPAPPARPARSVPWGWLEWMIIAQTAIPALLFVPGMGPLRLVTRVGVYGVALIAWAGIALGRRGGFGGPFPPRAWLTFCAVYLSLSLFHPNTNSLAAGLGSIFLYLAALSPAFWAGDALVSTRQIPRVLAIMFACNALSAAVGVGQVYQPARFNPPEMNLKVFTAEEGAEVALEKGEKIFKPCGLTDSPGAASGAGMIAALLGMCWAVAPTALWKRLGGVALAMVGLAAIYFAQVRTLLLLVAGCLVVVVVLLAMQRDFKRSTLLAGIAVGGILLSFTWAVAVMGGAVSNRFGSLLDDDVASNYHKNRGVFVQDTLEHHIPEYPLGAGLGRYGMMYAYLGDLAAPKDRGALWAEVQVTGFVFDGGVPLLIAYLGAVAVALLDSLRIALTSRDRELAFWATVITGSNLGALTLCFSCHVFTGTTGMQFWLLSGALHAADRLARRAGGPAGARLSPG